MDNPNRPEVGIQRQLIGRLDAALTAWSRPQKSLAKAVGISEKHLSQIMNAKAWPPAELWVRGGKLAEVGWWCSVTSPHPHWPTEQKARRSA